VPQPDAAAHADLVSQTPEHLGRGVVGVVNEYQLPTARCLGESRLEPDRQKAHVQSLIASGDDDRQRAWLRASLVAAGTIVIASLHGVA
jgi:hypothetical protein